MDVKTKTKLSTRISNLKSSAKVRCLAIHLYDYEYEQLLELGCSFCSKDLSYDRGTCLDRIDSNKDYTFHNVIPCCKDCNRAKGSMNINDFGRWIERIYTQTVKRSEKFKDNDISQVPSYKEGRELYRKFKTSDRNTLIDFKKPKQKQK